jgi:uncharacterized repeat protein (TIGR03803 family)
MGVRRVLLLAVLAGAGLAGWGARAAPLQTVYRFTGTADGAGPQALLAMGGMIYGTTHSRGGTGCYGDGCGTIFSIDKSTGGESSLYAFQGPDDGAYVFAGLTKHEGVLYGTAAAGGPDNLGTIFKYDPATGVITMLHGFQGGPHDGANPQGALIYHDGALYGTTTGGGLSGWGTVFTLDVATGAETVLYSFGGGADGAAPTGTLTYAAGALYGTTTGRDVASDYGTVFRLDLARLGGGATVLHRFGGGSDGAYPLASVIYVDGALFGTTQGGDTATDFGTVFRLATRTAGPNETVLHAFGGGHDGALPEAPLVFANGALYGTTVLGGGTCAMQAGCGIVFRLDPTGGTETILHSFLGGADGAYPESAVTLIGHMLYGTTFFGGGGCNGVGCGTVFRIPN